MFYEVELIKIIIINLVFPLYSFTSFRFLDLVFYIDPYLQFYLDNYI